MKILITNKHLLNFGGSELVTVELAEYFQSLGHQVLVYSETESRFPTINATRVKPDLDAFDLLWFHHWCLVDEFDKKPHQRVVFNHMSSYMEDEFSKDHLKEIGIADHIFCNSEETKKAIGISKAKLFQNPAPQPLLNLPKIKKALFVSNHRPIELGAMASKLDIPVDFVDYGNPRRLSTDIVSQYRFVVCNGKTVQYAIRAGVPIFLYDQFGGPGWLTQDNFERAAWYNFSGRGFDRCDLSDLLDWKTRGPVSMDDRFSIEGFFKREKILD